MPSMLNMNILPSQLTWLQPPSAGRPSHHGGDSPHHSPHPGVDDADALQWGVSQGVEAEIEGP